MTIISYTAGWAALGVGVRIYQLGLMQRNLAENLGGHALSGAAFGGIGYWLYGFKGRQEELLTVKREELKQMRKAQKARAEMYKKLDAAEQEDS